MTKIPSNATVLWVTSVNFVKLKICVISTTLVKTMALVNRETEVNQLITNANAEQVTLVNIVNDSLVKMKNHQDLLLDTLS